MECRDLWESIKVDPEQLHLYVLRTGGIGLRAGCPGNSQAKDTVQSWLASGCRIGEGRPYSVLGRASVSLLVPRGVGRELPLRPRGRPTPGAAAAAEV